MVSEMGRRAKGSDTGPPPAKRRRTTQPAPLAQPTNSSPPPITAPRTRRQTRKSNQSEVNAPPPTSSHDISQIIRTDGGNNDNHSSTIVQAVNQMQDTLKQMLQMVGSFTDIMQTTAALMTSQTQGSPNTSLRPGAPSQNATVIIDPHPTTMEPITVNNPEPATTSVNAQQQSQPQPTLPKDAHTQHGESVNHALTIQLTNPRPVQDAPPRLRDRVLFSTKQKIWSH